MFRSLRRKVPSERSIQRYCSGRLIAGQLIRTTYGREWLLNELIPRFEGRILPVDAAVGLLWGATLVRSKQSGHEIEAIDALIAATAERPNCFPIDSIA